LSLRFRYDQLLKETLPQAMKAGTFYLLTRNLNWSVQLNQITQAEGEELLRDLGFHPDRKLTALVSIYLPAIVQGFSEGRTVVEGMKQTRFGLKPYCIKEIDWDATIVVKYRRTEVRALPADLLLIKSLAGRFSPNSTELKVITPELRLLSNSIPYIRFYCQREGIYFPEWIKEEIVIKDRRTLNVWRQASREVREEAKRIFDSEFKNLSLEELRERYYQVRFRPNFDVKLAQALRFLIRRRLRKLGYYVAKDVELTAELMETQLKGEAR